ncbi:WD40 repeat domain-containing protein [Streptomyces sp. ST2-7A]|uniref:WD40 repeat domain-containing protein n=1 Tax=Streptomyces sp. ST2-7A TaxID=2907214 RepID=UPI001F193663|nr:WD40 repeat domain-containing protein [Streptomyces sp. ST2-7A]
MVMSVVTVFAGTAVITAPPAVAEEGNGGGVPEEFTIEDPRIVESSGLQASHRHPDVYWTHNDSDYAPEIYAVDGTTGRTVATVTLTGVEFRDVEAIHLGPDGDLWVGDIGDNFDGAWPHVWIYRFPEPETLADISLAPAVYTVTWEDGPRDAEALMVHPDTGRVHLASKRRDGSGAVYIGPEEMSTEDTNVFTRYHDTNLWVTDGAFSPDGTRLVLRGYFNAEIFGWSEGEEPESLGVVNVPLQPQGESVTFTPDGRTLMFGSEGAMSRVQPVELTGRQLPESVAARDTEEGTGTATEGGSDTGTDTGPDTGVDTDDGSRAAEEGFPTRTVIAVIAATVLVVALRRLFRGAGSRRR